jgi:four helix bundle protein
MSENELCKRLFQFAVDVIKFLRTIENNTETKIIKYQLIKSANSSGANYEESQGSSSKADFINKVRIALKEMRESNYWLRIIDEAEIKNPEQINRLINESEELKNILGSICVKAANKESIKAKIKVKNRT